MGNTSVIRGFFAWYGLCVSVGSHPSTLVVAPYRYWDYILWGHKPTAKVPPVPPGTTRPYRHRLYAGGGAATLLRYSRRPTERFSVVGREQPPTVESWLSPGLLRNPSSTLTPLVTGESWFITRRNVRPRYMSLATHAKIFAILDSSLTLYLIFIRNKPEPRHGDITLGRRRQHPG